MASRAVEVQVRVADLASVRAILNAAADLAAGVAEALLDENIEDTRAAVVLDRSLKAFKATVWAQSEAMDA